jgi:MFS family permease
MAHSHHHHSPLQVTEEHRGFRRGAAFIIGGLTSGHGVFHWLTQSFIVVLPEVRDLLLGGSVIATTSIQTTREIASGVVSLPGGVLTDALRRHWGWVMAVCMALFGVGWILMASGGWAVPGSSWLTAEQAAASDASGELNVLGYILLLVGMAVVGMAASFWHLPAVAALSAQFSHRRASVLSFHGVGGNVGDVIGPVLTGLLLSVLTWQGIITIYGAVPIFLAFLVFWAFRDIGQHRHGEEQERPASTMRHQIDETKILMRNGRMWGITAVAGLRGMAYIGFITVLPLYLADELGLRLQDGEGGFENLFYRGSLIGLLVLVGIFASPIMGYLSDRFGRKLVLIPGMAVLAALTFLMASLGDTLTGMTILLAGLGLFLYSDQPILTATAMDIVREGTAATTLGLMSTSRFIFSAISPLIAGALYTINPDNLFYYTTALYLAAIVILFFIRLPRATPVPAGDDHHDHGHEHAHASTESPAGEHEHGQGHEHDHRH